MIGLVDTTRSFKTWGLVTTPSSEHRRVKSLISSTNLAIIRFIEEIKGVFLVFFTQQNSVISLHTVDRCHYLI